MLSRLCSRIVQRHVVGINTISSKPSECVPPKRANRTIVLVHGFGGGCCNFVPNWATFEQVASVHAIDLPGFGRSVREKRSFSSSDDAIDYFVSNLELWFKDMNFSEPVVLLGHSFGGYLCSHFTIRNPGKVKHLVLADPWGVPRQPADDGSAKKLPFKFRVALWAFYKTAPLSILRAAGPLGPKVLPKFRPDFEERWSRIIDDPKAFYDYTYHCNAGRPTGELGFQACCVGRIFAQQPLLDILPNKHLPSLPVTVVYGQQSWMDKSAGVELVKTLQAMGCSATVDFISGAGHQLNSDNPAHFALVVMQRLKWKFPEAIRQELERESSLTDG